jgi:hypothetical protein
MNFVADTDSSPKARKKVFRILNQPFLPSASPPKSSELSADKLSAISQVSFYDTIKIKMDDSYAENR